MANLSKEGNIQHKLGFAGLLITLGIVFGDIGTSPLYVMKAIIHTGEALDENYVLGALSCIIWTLTLQTTVKYVLVALRADNNGEVAYLRFMPFYAATEEGGFTSLPLSVRALCLLMVLSLQPLRSQLP